VLAAVQLAESMPLTLSDQFQVTVTSLLFHSAPLRAGDWVGLAVGGAVSGTTVQL